MRPSIRLAALIGTGVPRADANSIGSAGRPTHQPIEHLSSFGRCRTARLPPLRRGETDDAGNWLVCRAPKAFPYSPVRAEPARLPHRCRPRTAAPGRLHPCRASSPPSRPSISTGSEGAGALGATRHAGRRGHPGPRSLPAGAFPRRRRVPVVCVGRGLLRGRIEGRSGSAVEGWARTGFIGIPASRLGSGRKPVPAFSAHARCCRRFRAEPWASERHTRYSKERAATMMSRSHQLLRPLGLIVMRAAIERGAPMSGGWWPSRPSLSVEANAHCSATHAFPALPGQVQVRDSLASLRRPATADQGDASAHPTQLPGGRDGRRLHRLSRQRQAALLLQSGARKVGLGARDLA